MENTEFKDSKVYNIAQIVEYIPHSVVIKSVIRKKTGNVSISSFDTGEVMIAKISPFDILLHIIEGMAEIIIDDTSFIMGVGEIILIPAHSRNTIKANGCFKMMSTIIKSGYEDVSL